MNAGQHTFKMYSKDDSTNAFKVKIDVNVLKVQVRNAKVNKESSVKVAFQSMLLVELAE